MAEVAESVVEAGALLGEGPIWDSRRGVLWWVDFRRQELHAFDPESGRD